MCSGDWDRCLYQGPVRLELSMKVIGITQFSDTFFILKKRVKNTTLAIRG